MSEDINEILHITEAVCICNGTVSELVTNSIMGSFMDQVLAIPTDVLSCLSQITAVILHFRFITVWAGLYFLFDECCSLDKCLVLLRDLCGGFDMQSCSLLTDGLSDMVL